MAAPKLDTPPRLTLITPPTRADHLRRASAYRVIRLGKQSRGKLLDRYAAESHPDCDGLAWLDGPAHNAWHAAFRAYSRAYAEHEQQYGDVPAHAWAVR